MNELELAAMASSRDYGDAVDAAVGASTRLVSTQVIDVNYYPVQEAENSNMRHRPIGIGVQGLADALVKLRLPYEGDAARQLNKDIFETIYYGGVPASYLLHDVILLHQTRPGVVSFPISSLDVKHRRHGGLDPTREGTGHVRDLRGVSHVPRVVTT